MEPLEIVLTSFIMLICLLLEMFFSGAEIGIVSANKLKLRHQAAKGSHGAKLALKMLKNPERLLSTTLVGSNITMVINATLATGLMIALFGNNGIWLAIIFVVPFIWIFGEIVPKSVFQHHADVITPRIIFLLDIASRLFAPILFGFSKTTKFLTWVAGGDKDKNPFTLREEIDWIIKMPSEGGDIAPQEQKMIRRVFDFTETTAQEAMIPLSHVAAIEKNQTCQDAKQLAMEKSHIRLPVYDQRVDKIIGVLNVLEVIKKSPESPIEPYIKPVRFIPGTVSIQTLLVTMRKTNAKLVIVVDEFGGAAGVVTVEDIMEEVVEELNDEYDEHQQNVPLVHKVKDFEYVVNARIELDALTQELGVHFERGDYTTVAGLILNITHNIPAVGTVIKSGDITFTIMQGTSRVIHEVNIKF